MRKLLSLMLAVMLLGPAQIKASDATRIILGAPIPLNMSAVAAFTNCTIDTATKQCAWIFQGDGAVVTTLLFRYGLRTGTPVAHIIGIQGVSATTGDPDGTFVATATFTPPADTTWDGKIQAITLSHDGAGNVQATYTLTRGTMYALVTQPCQGATAPCAGATTPDGSNKSTFTQFVDSPIDAARGLMPYSDSYSGVAWTKVVGGSAVFGYRSASLTYGNPIQAVSGNNTISSGAEEGGSFTIPSGWWTSFQVVGVRLVFTPGAAGKTYKIVLYSGTTVLQSVTLDTDIVGAVTNNRPATILFAGALSTLNTGTLYRIGISPQAASQNSGITTVDLAAAGDRTAFSGQTMWAYSTRTGCGAPCDGTATAWAADTTTSLPLIGLILDVITAPAGAGGQHAYSFAQ